MTKLALSTAWNAFRHNDARSLVEEITSIGFNELELNFSLSRKIVEGVALLQKNGQIKVESLHNYCPLPEGQSPLAASPDYYSLSSLDESERSKAIENTKKTIDTAVGLDARAVVLHAGRVEIPDNTKTLIQLYETGKKDSQEFTRIKDEFIRERNSRARPHVEAVLKSIEELAGYAQMAGICLGIENRFYYREIPSLDEIALILDRFRNSNVFYWHDVGHAQVMENLGFFKHRDYLENYKDRLIGVHIHGIKGCRDHLAPFESDLDLNNFIPYFKKNTLKVIESHSSATKEDLVEAKYKLEKLFHG